MSETICCDFFEHLISGNIFSDFDVASGIFSNDLFLVTRNNEGNLSSYAISYDQLSSAVLADWNKSLSVKSMAYEETWKYAKAEHDHDGVYNALSIRQLAFPGHDIQCIALLSTTSSSNIISVYSPIIVSEDPPEYEIGTLKFVCSKNAHSAFTNADLENDNFDGWVYADGTTFSPTNTYRYQKALNAFGNGDSATSFTVPDISEFIQAASSPILSIQTFPQQLGIAEHQHDISQILFDGDIKLKSGFTFDTYQTGSSSNDKQYRSNIHYGVDKDAKVGNTQFKFDLQQVAFDLSCDNYGTLNQKFEPRHRNIPVMIYIGGVKY